MEGRIKKFCGLTHKSLVMKNLLILILFFFSSCFSFNKGYNYTEPKLPSKKDFHNIALIEYQLIKIDTVSYRYNNIFFYKKNDSIYKVVSKKEKTQPCKKLIINNYYPLKLKGLRSKMILNYLDVGGIMMYGREPVSFERDSKIIWNLYITPYIKGLCYQED